MRLLIFLLDQHTEQASIEKSCHKGVLSIEMEQRFDIIVFFETPTRFVWVRAVLFELGHEVVGVISKHVDCEFEENISDPVRIEVWVLRFLSLEQGEVLRVDQVVPNIDVIIDCKLLQS